MSAKDNKNSSLFKVGKVFNPIVPIPRGKPVLKYQEIVLRYPSRLNAMAIDPGSIKPRKDLKYTPGEVIFSVGIYKTVRLRARSDKSIVVSRETTRQSLVRHSALIMKAAIGFSEGFDIKVENKTDILHSGLGSSSGLISSVAVAINEAYGNPIAKSDLIRYIAQNHGEEVEGEEMLLNSVQSIGGSAAAGLCQSGMTVLAGEAIPIATMKIPSEYEAVIGIPSDFIAPDSMVLMEKELKVMHQFITTGKLYGPKNAYNVLHLMLPAMKSGNLKIIGDVIFEYRYNMGSIKNCSFSYPGLERTASLLIPLREDGIAPIISISSVGPGVFTITKNPKKCQEYLRRNGFTTYRAPICNSGYECIRRTK